MCRVFIIDDDKKHNDFYPQLLEDNGFEVFSTENAFKLVSYAKELKPELYVLNSQMENTNYSALVEHLVVNGFADKAPLVSLYDDKLAAWQQGVSHYIYDPDDKDKLPQIASAYCAGGAKYDVLLLDDFLPPDDFSVQFIKELNISYFNVYNVQAAKLFLQKNEAKAVFVHSSPKRYKELKLKPGIKNVFYVENMKNLKDLVSFIG